MHAFEKQSRRDISRLYTHKMILRQLISRANNAGLSLFLAVDLLAPVVSNAVEATAGEKEVEYVQAI